MKGAARRLLLNCLRVKGTFPGFNEELRTGYRGLWILPNVVIDIPAKQPELS